jgi:hypothetical protein
MRFCVFSEYVITYLLDVHEVWKRLLPEKFQFLPKNEYLRLNGNDFKSSFGG